MKQLYHEGKDHRFWGVPAPVTGPPHHSSRLSPCIAEPLAVLTPRGSPGADHLPTVALARRCQVREQELQEHLHKLTVGMFRLT